MPTSFDNCPLCGQPKHKVSKRCLTCFRTKCAGRPDVPLTERFWKHVQKTDSCWLWTGKRHPRGYGHVEYQGRTLIAPRVAWELVNGPIPDGLWVLHNCPGGDNPACVNPAHLYLGTHQDNVTDMRRKGRGTMGDTHPNSKVTSEQVCTMRERYARGGVTLKMLEAEYGIDRRTVGQIVKRKAWSHIK